MDSEVVAIFFIVQASFLAEGNWAVYAKDTAKKINLAVAEMQKSLAGIRVEIAKCVGRAILADS